MAASASPDLTRVRHVGLLIQPTVQDPNLSLLLVQPRPQRPCLQPVPLLLLSQLSSESSNDR